MGYPENSTVRAERQAGSRFSLSTGLKLFAVGTAVVFLVLAALSDYRNSLTRIGSADYQRIVQGKDLIADILPPPSFVIEAYLAIVQASQEPWNRDTYFAEYRAHKDAYFAQLKYWEKADIPENIRKLITVDSPTALDRFWIEAENNFFPKLEKSGGMGLGAAEINQSLGILKERFKEHRTIVLRASEAAAEYLKSVEIASDADMRELGWMYYGATALSLMLIFGFLVSLNRGVVRPLTNIAGFTAALARGETSADVPYVERGDEVGSIARALTIFKEVGAEKLEAERQAATEREQMASVKAEADAELAEKAEETSRAVSLLGAALTRLADGELDCQIAEPFQGELETLRADFNMALSRIAGAFARIAASAGSIESGSREIVTASDDMTRRTEQQAASLEQTSATLEQITATVQKSAEGAENTRQIVNTAKQDAEASEQVVSRALAAMSDIEKSASEISQIIASSTRSPSRPISWRSMPASRPRVPVTRARALRLSPRKSVNWRSALPPPPRRSRALSTSRPARSRTDPGWSTRPARRCTASPARLSRFPASSTRSPPAPRSSSSLSSSSTLQSAKWTTRPSAMPPWPNSRPPRAIRSPRKQKPLPRSSRASSSRMPITISVRAIANTQPRPHARLPATPGNSSNVSRAHSAVAATATPLSRMNGRNSDP